jgi:hypothetical protein
MATNDLQALFGGNMLPEEYQQQLLEKRASDYAKLSLDERIAQGTYKSAYGVGEGLAKAFGVDIQDPAFKRQSELRKLSEGVTPNAEGLAQYATRLSERGYQTEAAQAFQKSAELRKIEAETTSKTMERMTNEQKNAAAIADASGATRGTPEWGEKFSTELNRLTAGSKGANIKEIGVAEGTRQPVYFDASTDTQFVMRQNPTTGKQERMPFNGGVDRTTARTSVDARNMGESEFVKELAKLDAKKVNEAFTVRENAVNSITSLNKLASLPDSELITGQFATGRVGVANLLATLGLASPADATRVSTSQQYQKVAGDVILQTLGGKLGSGFSNADREFIASLVPQLETNPEARRKLITFMQGKNQDIVKETTRLENYARDNKGLKGFEPKIPMSVTPTGSNRYAGLSDAELNARIAAAQKAGK